MNSKFKITIPKPCHENWHGMSPKEKGRFCGSCTKTVIDFTKKSTIEIQDYLIEHKNQQVCGHFYKKQLDTITIEIPQITFQQQLSFQKLFMLALFFVMGTTLFSCQYADGKTQKIQEVIFIDTIRRSDQVIDSIRIDKDSLINHKTIKFLIPPPPEITGLYICETPPEKDSINTTKKTEQQIEIVETMGDIMLVEGEISYEEFEDDIIMGMIIEEHPRFKEAKNISNEKAKEDFEERMKKFVLNNFDKKRAQNLGLSEGKHTIYTQFVIDKNGNVIDINVRAPHPKLKEEVTKMLEKLPQFMPGKQANKVVKTKYNLPITFVVE